MRKGTRLDALKFSLGANQANGLRRTNADKRHCVELALKEFPKLSDRAIAGMCGVSHPFVSEMRPKQLVTVTSSPREGLDGKERRMPTRPAPVAPEPEPEERPHVVAGPVAPAGNIPKRHCVELALKEFPKLSDRAIAGMCGVSPSSVAEYRPQLSKLDSSPREGLDGKERRMPVRAPAAPDPEPEERPHVVAGPKCLSGFRRQPRPKPR